MTGGASACHSAISAGRIGLCVRHAAARFDDITVTETTTTPPTSEPPTSGPPTSQPPTSQPPTSQPPSGTLYVAPNGVDGASGTQAAPTTLTSALTRVSAGGTIFMRGGTYNFSQTVTIAQGNNGTASARKNLYAFRARRRC